MYREFKGGLDGVTLDEIKEEFFEDYYDQEHSADERVEDVKRFIKEQSNGFFEDYYCEQYLAKTPSQQVMSDQDNVCHFVEIMASYVITGEDDDLPYDKDLFFIGN